MPSRDARMSFVHLQRASHSGPEPARDRHAEREIGRDIRGGSTMPSGATRTAVGANATRRPRRRPATPPSRPRACARVSPAGELRAVGDADGPNIGLRAYVTAESMGANVSLSADRSERHRRRRTGTCST